MSISIAGKLVDRVWYGKAMVKIETLTENQAMFTRGDGRLLTARPSLLSYAGKTLDQYLADGQIGTPGQQKPDQSRMIESRR